MRPPILFAGLGYVAILLLVMPAHAQWSGEPGSNLKPAGTLNAPAPPEASVSPTELHFYLAPGETDNGTVTLSNSGGSALTFTAAFEDRETIVVDFEDEMNLYNFTLGIPAADYIDQTGGNPGKWFRNSSLSTFAPSLYIPEHFGSPFVGDFVEREVDMIVGDARTVSAPFGVEGRPYSLVLINFNGEPGNVEAHHYVYYPGPLAPQAGQGWEKYSYEIPYDYTGDMPEGWGGGYYGDPENLPPGVTFQDVISTVNEVRLMWGHPAFFYLLQDFDIGVDNVGVRFKGETSMEVAVEPTEGTVAPGASADLTVSVDASGLEGGDYEYVLNIETNDPDNPVLPVLVNLHVIPVGTDPDAPLTFALEQNFPNPFGDASTISFTLAEPGEVLMEVFDVMGRRVATLVDAELQSGRHEVTWDASELASGTYIYRLRAGARAQMLRATIMR